TTSLPAQEGRLQQVRQGPPSPPPAPPLSPAPAPPAPSPPAANTAPHAQSQDSSSSDDDPFTLEDLSVLAVGGVVAAASPFYVPAALLGDKWEGQGYFADYPF